MNSKATPSIAADEIIGFMNNDQTDFSAFSREEQIRHFEVEGYVVFPGILDSKQGQIIRTDGLP